MTKSDACAARIRREHAELQDLISAALPAPAGHHWMTPRLHFTWFANDTLASTAYGCHLYLSPLDGSDANTRQLRIEVRWFWRATDDTPANARPRRDTDCERAILWCEVGPNIVGRSKSLLSQSAEHLRADGIPALAAAAIENLRPAIARWEAEYGTPTAEAA